MLVGQQLPGRLPRPRADVAQPLRAGRDAPRRRRRHRGGDEVLRARRAGERLPALRPVDDVRRHRLARRSPRSSRRSAPARSTSAVLVLGTVFVVAGLAFKLGAVPFHMWVPDVYQGAPTAVTLLVGGAPKLAAFAITIRLLVEGMLGLAVDWQQMLVAAVGRARCCSATWRRSRRPTSSACWPTRRSPRSASCCSACARRWSAATRSRRPTPTARRCSTSSPTC